MAKETTDTHLDTISKYFQNHSDAEKLINSLKSKFQKDNSPEVALPLFLLLFAQMENYLQTIVQSVLVSTANQKGIEIDVEEFEDMTFGQILNIFEDIFVKNKFVLKAGKNKLNFTITFRFETLNFNDTNVKYLFQKEYLIKYVKTLRDLKNFRNNLYHNLFSYNKGRNLEKFNINNMTKTITQILDLNVRFQGTYRNLDFDEDYYDKLSKAKNFEKEVMLATKSLISKHGTFPPQKYVSINMLLRIMFYHYSFVFMNLKNGEHF